MLLLLMTVTVTAIATLEGVAGWNPALYIADPALCVGICFGMAALRSLPLDGHYPLLSVRAQFVLLACGYLLATLTEYFGRVQPKGDWKAGYKSMMIVDKYHFLMFGVFFMVLGLSVFAAYYAAFVARSSSLIPFAVLVGAILIWFSTLWASRPIKESPLPDPASASQPTAVVEHDGPPRP